MDSERKIKSALISVFHKDGLEEIVRLLDKHKVKIISTGGTAEFVRELNIPVTEVESVTNYPAMFGGRVKTLQPQIFGGILNRRNDPEDQAEKGKHQIEDIDLVLVDLYPFEETLEKGGSEKEIIEKIDIGGVSLIRAAAKNFNDVVVVPSKKEYAYLKNILEKTKENNCVTTLDERKFLAGKAFEVTSRYDFSIRSYFQGTKLRYGENPHQEAVYVGDLNENFTQLSGKALSYNNLIDTEAAIMTVFDFEKPAFAIIKHMNACGLSVKENLFEACKAAYSADPVSAFGGILAANKKIEGDVAKLIREQKLFVEVIIAPDFSEEALQILKEKKDCRILKSLPAQAGTNSWLPKKLIRTNFTGFLIQDRDGHIETLSDLKCVTKRPPSETETNDLLVAAVATKHLKSNSVALVKEGTLLAMGCGQTSRIDALGQAIEKAKKFGFSLEGAVLSSEAFFPFPDCVELAGQNGVSAVIQPGGSKNDQVSIDMADKYNMAMVTTGYRHFKH